MLFSMYLNHRMCLALIAVSCLSGCQAHQLPEIDLGYEIHRAISYNETSQVYNFTNIRYARPPVGELRFNAPQPPTGRNPVVQDGSVGAICPQATPAWVPIGLLFSTAYVMGQPFDFNATVGELEANNQSAPPSDPRTNEDCLFLDVLVPKPVFEHGQRYRTRGGKGQGAAVLVWIYGGGYTLGEKGGDLNPSGLIEASKVDDSEGLIFVAMNYRLGALGWLSGPTLQAVGVSNAGLYDQRLALDWVRDNIHLFGGDPGRVTVMGESAGGGSIMHQITAYGGAVPSPFQQAILQSPAFLPTPSRYLQEEILQEFLAILNVTTIEEARQLPSTALIAANSAQVGLRSVYGSFKYGPVVDGSFVPAIPGELLSQGDFDRNITVMVGHTSDEGVVFADPRVTDDRSLAAYIRQSFPSVQDSVVRYIIDTLYPAVYDGSEPYRNGLDRTILVISELLFTCNANYLARAYSNETYNYQFSVPPGLHGLDLPYTFYTGVSTQPGFNTTVAQALQQYLTSFAQKGEPSGEGFADFPLYGPSATELDLNVSAIQTIKDPTDNPRCLYWQKALYY